MRKISSSAESDRGDQHELRRSENPELQEKLKSAKTAEELIALAKEQGLELSDEQLEAISGGTEWYQVCEKHAYCRELPHQPV